MASAVPFAGVVLIALILIGTPAVLDRVGGSTDHWQRLGAMATACTAIFAVFVVVALTLSTYGVVLQARESRSNREFAVHQENGRLMELTIQYPYLNLFWGIDTSCTPEQRVHLDTYANRVFMLWEFAHETGSIGENTLRINAECVFAFQPARDFWQGARQMRWDSAETGRAKRFCRIVDAAYQRCVAETTPAAPPPRDSGESGDAPAERRSSR